MDEIKLKPCPFCGDEAEINMLMGEYIVNCKSCHAGIFPDYSKIPLSQLVEEWNRRENND